MPCDLLFCLELEEPRKRHSRMIDKALHEEKRRFRRQVKILLLGAGESGKSTFVKQIRIMHGDSFSDHALKDFVITIRQNIIMGMKVLLDARRKLGIPWKDPLHEAQARRFFNCDVQMAVEDDHFMAVSSIICSLWQDSALKLVFERRREFQLGDSIKYFLVELPRIGLKDGRAVDQKKPTGCTLRELFWEVSLKSSRIERRLQTSNLTLDPEDYKPSNLDILHARKATKGITEYIVKIQGVPFLFVDVGGQRSQRQKWFQCFESVNAILFLAAVNEYDQVLLEDRETSRIMESCAIFETIVNNLVFVDVAVIVFFNKTDLLEDKYRKCLISQYFPNFMGDPTDLRHVKGFLFDTFDQRRKDRSKSLYHHWTSVIDTQHTQQIFSYVREEIRRENLKQIGLF